MLICIDSDILDIILLFIKVKISIFCMYKAGGIRLKRYSVWVIIIRFDILMNTDSEAVTVLLLLYYY